MNKYLNRQEAGKILAESLRSYANRKDVMVLALPRGGVPVAFEIAQALNVPLDVYIVRKLGVPGHSELAMGAIAMGNVTVFNHDIIKELGVSQEEIETVIEIEKQELIRREKLYRGHRPFPDIHDKTIILVDDGVATGATLRAAMTALRKAQPAKLIVAVPVADRHVIKQFISQADLFICPLQPEQLYAVGAWYENFSQTEDEEVHQYLTRIAKQRT